MLRIFFGDNKDVLYGPTWFKYNYDPSWFKDELVQDMVREVDNTEYVEASAFDSPILGMISPERLSGEFFFQVMQIYFLYGKTMVELNHMDDCIN